MMRKFLILFIALSITRIAIGQIGKPEDVKYLVVLSMDGFRYDYIEKAATPTFDSIARIGVKSKGFIPAFPSKTFPNHYTMATGLYPDNHGLVNNTFYDPETGTTYRMGDSSTRNNPYYYGGEPIWVTASKAGLKTASYFWVGTELPIKGIQPDYWKLYDGSTPFEARMDTVIYWLGLPEEQRPRLIMWYLQEPDESGHIYGPESNEIFDLVSYLDKLVSDFCRKINQLPHAGQINLIFTSDHGMGQLSNDRVIDLATIISPDWVEKVVGGNPNYNIKAKPEYLDTIFQRLNETENIKVWKNPDLPARLNYGKNPRTLDLTVAADLGWSINWQRYSNYRSSGGTHGYDPAYPEMHAIFYAIGPSFKRYHLHPAIENVNLYVLMAELLGLSPAPNDGDLEKVIDMLRP